MHKSVPGIITQQTCFLQYKYRFARVTIARRCFPDVFGDLIELCIGSQRYKASSGEQKKKKLRSDCEDAQACLNSSLDEEFICCFACPGSY